MASRRRGLGVSAVQRKQETQAKFTAKGNEMAGEQLKHFSGQLEEFTVRLEEFARKHRDEIKKNSQFRRHFQEMCASVGVDPLASGKGFWAEKLGVGDFYYELAVQIVEVCLSTNHINGGIMTVEEIRNRLMRSRSRTKKETITADDILRAVDKLKVLGGGFELIALGGGRFLVQSVPGELSMDHSRVLQLAEDAAYVTKELIMDRLRWDEARAQSVLDHLLKEGLAWVDSQPSDTVQYWMGELVLPADALSPSNYMEKYVLTGQDSVVRFNTGRNVVLNLEDGAEPRERDSSRVHTQLISEYKWERREFGGQLLGVHDRLVAYRIFSETNDSVRVIHSDSKQRQLIKGFRAPTADLAWAAHVPMLAVVDSQGNLYVYHVNDQCNIRKFVNIMRDSPIGGGLPWLSWCNYVQEDEDDEQLVLLSIAQGSVLDVVNLSVIRKNLTSDQDDIEMTFDQLCGVKGAVHTITFEGIVTAVCISPDATAVAIAVDNGDIYFYMLEGGEAKLANTWKPEMGGHVITQLIFLDNVTNKQPPEQFWRYCVAVADGGKRIQLFDCETWGCIGRLRLDFALHASPFTVYTDSSARYLHIVDVDGANIFSVELDYSRATPRLCSVTQVGFCHPIVTAVPFAITENNEDVEDDNSLCDDEDEDARPLKNTNTIQFIAINYKNVVQLDVTLEKTADTELCDMVDAGVTDAADAQASTSGLRETESEKEKIPVADIQARLDEISENIERLTLRADRADSERRAAATNEDIVNLLKQFKEEFSLREDRLLANVSEMIEANRDETVNVVRNALNENSLAVENSIQANHMLSADGIHQRVAEKTKEAIVQLVLPTIERTCTQLFKQLNEHFRQGMEQYLNQLRALQTSQLVAATPAPLATERQVLVQQLQSFLLAGNVAVAFETALNLADEEAILYVCQHVNPEELFQKENVLPQPVLLPLLQQLCRYLDKDTDIKFRYMEFVLTAINVYDADIGIHVPGVISAVTHNLKEFQQRTADANLRRQARMLCQVAAGLTKI